ncbi:hypothetical protein ACXWQW_09575, partial [Streptococcus pyogenes]
KIDGVKFNLYKLPLEFTPKGIKYLNTNEEKENIEGFEEADSILVSISQQPRDLIVSNTKGINVGGDGLVVTNENGETTR